MIDRRTMLTVSAASLTALYAQPLRAANTSKPLGAWKPLADMPFATQEIYPAAFQTTQPGGDSLKPTRSTSLLINAGGLTPDDDYNVTDAVTVYDVTTNSWRYTTPLPEPRHHVALVNNNGFLFAVGGFARNAEGGWQMRASSWRLSALDGRWESIGAMPHPRGEAVCASLNGFIHVAGGRAPAGSLNREWSDHIDTDEHWYYDASDDRWRALAPLPSARNSSAGAVINGVLYVIGGRTVNDGNSAAVDVYDPMSERWNAARPMPKAQGGLAAAALNGKIYAFGGEYFSPSPGGVYADCWEYDPDADTWRAVAPMLHPRHGLGAVTLSDAIYVIGGAAKAGGNETSAALDKFEM